MQKRHRVALVVLLVGVDVEHQQVVPALVNALGDTNSHNRMVAAQRLRHFGANARQAVPALLLLLGDPYPIVRSSATNTLKKIDPEAATRAGVK